jgi:hypothetical protein
MNIEFLEDTAFYDVADHIVMLPEYSTGDWLTLGEGSYCSAKLEGLGTPEMVTDELALPGRDGISFGREHFGSRKWTITGAIKSGDLSGAAGPADDAWNALARLLRAWDYNPARGEAGAVIPLIWKRPGRRTVVIYGRPERLDPDTSRAFAGFISYTAVFRQSDVKFYDADEQTITATLVAPPSGGLLLNPAMNALLATDGKLQTTAVVVNPTALYRSDEESGDIETNPIITFYGPVLNPQLRMLSDAGGTRWSVKLLTNVGYGQSITIDTRHWAQTVRRTPDGANMAGFIRSPRLRDVTIPLGTNVVEYSGQDATSTSMCEIRFRNAWASV